MLIKQRAKRSFRKVFHRLHKLEKRCFLNALTPEDAHSMQAIPATYLTRLVIHAVPLPESVVRGRGGNGWQGCGQARCQLPRGQYPISIIDVHPQCRCQGHLVYQEGIGLPAVVAERAERVKTTTACCCQVVGETNLNAHAPYPAGTRTAASVPKAPSRPGSFPMKNEPTVGAPVTMASLAMMREGWRMSRGERRYNLDPSL